MDWMRLGRGAWKIEGKDDYATVVVHPEKGRGRARANVHWKVVARHGILGVMPVRVGEGWRTTVAGAKKDAERVLRKFEMGE